MAANLLVTTETMADGRELLHERVPFVSYAAEWPFSLMKRAALLHLELLLAILPGGFTLQDADPANVQFWGGRPVFIDVPSIVPAPVSRAWPALGQFCDAMLYPLLLESQLGVDWRPWLRASPGGIDVHEVSRLFGWRQYRSRMAFTHIYLRRLLERVGAPLTARDTTALASDDDAKVLPLIIGRLRDAVAALRPAKANSTVWADYHGDDCHYEEQATATKLDAIARIASQLPADSLVLDLGTNAGRFAHAVAKEGARVVAIDAAADAVEKLAASTSATERSAILPLVVNLANPTPAQGWGGWQYLDISERGPRPDMVMALALIHHLRVSANIPFELQFAWFESLAPRLVVEWVAPEDRMAQQLLTRKTVAYEDFTLDSFEQAFEPYYRLLGKTVISPTRTLYDLSPR